MPISKSIHLLGYPSGHAAPDIECGDGPFVMKKSNYLNALTEKGINLTWEEILQFKNENYSKIELIAKYCENLAKQTRAMTKEKQFFTVIGGDHSSAIGTWSGVYDALKKEGPFGLIWFDAHMDSHTPHTSVSGNIHGMPLACLLGYGMPSLTEILDKHPKIKPEHLCLIGVRSFERGEAALLKELNVRIFFMEEVRQRGLNDVMKEAIQIATKNTVGFGVSIDIDSIDPKDAPATGVPEPNGLSAKDLCEALQLLGDTPHFIGAEIAEFNPHLDQEAKTEKLIPHLIASLVLGNRYYDVFKDCHFHTVHASL